MKKAILCGSIQIALVAGALAQGTVFFENSASTGTVYIGLPPAFSPPGIPGSTITVALLWAPGTSVVPQGSLTQIGTYTYRNDYGYFADSSTLTTGAGTAGGTPAIFEVEGWLGTYTNATDAIAHGGQIAYSSEFVNGTGNPTPPATPPIETTGWDGNLYFIPEPSTLALGACGGLLLWARYRRASRVSGSKFKV